MVTVYQVKNLLYLDGNDDDALITTYVDAAESFVVNAVGDDKEFWKDPHVASLQDMAVMSLAATYYQNRLALSDTQTFPIDLTVNSIIGQLRGLYAEIVEDKGGDTDADADKPAQPSD